MHKKRASHKTIFQQKNENEKQSCHQPKHKIKICPQTTFLMLNETPALRLA